MKIHLKTFILLGVLAMLSLGLNSYAQDNTAKFKLKPGAYGKLCLDCHPGFQDKLKKQHVHTPVKNGNCSGCHNPHTSAFSKLLESDASKICASCHKTLVVANPLSVHKPVADGACMKCHDPHSSVNKNNLLKTGNELCLECHKSLADTLAKIKVKHNPVEKGCLNCHDPHASAKDDSLLKERVTALCIGCHKTDRPSFIKQHMNYPVATSRCTSCHDPHGSDRKGILYNNVHKPVSTRMCNQCHEEATSGTPLKIKREGAELCRGCHSDMFNATFGKKRMHSPLLSKKGCLTCHNPHAAKEKGLLKESPLVLCGSCHADTIKRQAKSVTKHEPVKNGNCVACHDPHASDSALLAKQASVVDLCASCHDWMKHSTHPIGDKFVDPRNKNATLNCLSCHRSHGTEYKGMMPFPAISDLCTQCHEQFRR
ncbi:cytochrome c [Geomonas limicola]|uniref:Cytochrome c n=1 Tax=Geomonas limicola TaxID=2740186 RepID=A0A6V8NHM5_9BACT|nr:cytochrome c3 family protein [Geomonas limicola]GFO70429.1 cytochrome c [Geomonas limicola]